MRINSFTRKQNISTESYLSAEKQLRRAVLSCLLWEDEYYENGESIAKRIQDLSSKVDKKTLANLAIEARNEHNLRHAPLLLLNDLVAHGGSIVGDTIDKVIKRPDEITEFLSLYWKDGKKPISKQIKKGLSKVFNKFDEYQLAKYNRDTPIKLRDALFMVHAKPENKEKEILFKKLAENTLATPDTWEVGLSTNEDKKDTFERLLREGKMGYMALLKNLRNMVQNGVDIDLIREAILARKGADRVLPFRFTSAARACPQMEPYLDEALSETIANLPVMKGKTIVLVDVSGSMNQKLSGKSDLTRMDAAATLGSIINGDIRVFTFSEKLVEVPPRRGMAGIDTIINSQSHYSTNLSGAINTINQESCDRLIVITDEQVIGGRVPSPHAKRSYMINVSSYNKGISYGNWNRVDGFSEQVLKWINEYEQSEETEK